MKDLVKGIVGGVLARAPKGVQTAVKERAELWYWRRNLRRSRGAFYNRHFERVFTNTFDLPASQFEGKRMLDIGCGPVGTLEWAGGAAERVGVDPLASRYLALNRGLQAMRYVEAPAERLPFKDGHFDIVSIFNALDHVEDTIAACREAVRVLRPGGDLLVIVEINHAPTVTEPHTLRADVLERFPGCAVVRSRACAINGHHDVYGSIFENRAPAADDAPSILCARLLKAPTAHPAVQ